MSTASNMTQRIQMTWFCKYSIIVESEHRGVKGGSQLKTICEWAIKTFKLFRNPMKSTILRILRSKTQIEGNIIGFFTNRRRSLSVSSIKLEKQMSRWVGSMWCNGVFINDAAIQEKVRKIQVTLNPSSSNKLSSSNKGSNGWIYRF